MALFLYNADCPIIIDQSEDDIDNSTIYEGIIKNLLDKKDKNQFKLTFDRSEKLAIEIVKKGIRRDRNPIILNFLEKEKEFKYNGMGRRIERILFYCKKEGIKVEFINDKNKNLFKVILLRKEG